MTECHKQIAKWLEELKQLKEQESCEDAISRDELLKAIDTWDKFGCDADTKLVSYQDHDIPYIHYDDAIKCIKGMPSITPTQRWIPCSEKPPKESGKYLVTFGGTHLIGIDCYTTEEDANKIFEEPEEYIGWRSQNVVAWKSLPEPYKIESERKDYEL